MDAELTDKGEDEARALLEHTEPHLKPQLLIVSPLRRATVTGLLAFEPHVKRGELRVMAHELCHERAGRHTCDKRLAKSKLQALYPAVDYSQLEAEEDPFWGDGWTREPWQDVRVRPNAIFLSRHDLPSKDVRPKANQPPKLLPLLSLTQHALPTFHSWACGRESLPRPSSTDRRVTLPSPHTRPSYLPCSTPSSSATRRRRASGLARARCAPSSSPPWSTFTPWTAARTSSFSACRRSSQWPSPL